MNLLKSTILIFVICLNNIYAQNEKKFYVNQNQDYVILLDSDVKISHQKISSTDVDIFVKTDKSSFNYTLLISKIFEHNFTKGNLIDESYKDYFLQTCECSIIDSEEVLYNNLNTLRFKIKVVKEGKSFIGYNDSFVSNGSLYNVMFLTFENDFKTQSRKYSPIMNTLIVNGKTTIDSYKEYEN